MQKIPANIFTCEKAREEEKKSNLSAPIKNLTIKSGFQEVVLKARSA